MSLEYECDKIQEFIDEVESLIDAIEGQEMASNYFESELSSVQHAKRSAESELEDIRRKGGVDVDDALREAKRVKEHLEEATEDLDDCITALEG